jgi:hypothetical protein
MVFLLDSTAAIRLSRWKPVRYMTSDPDLKERIREQLGLLTREQYLAQRDLRRHDRQSGRTLELILEALAASQTYDGVLIESANNRISKGIVLETRRYAQQLNEISNLGTFNLYKFQAFAGLSVLCGLDLSRYKILTDHTRAKQLAQRCETELASIDYLLEARVRATNHINEYIMPLTTSRPEVCEGCLYYNGERAGGNLLICAVHPYGVATTSCADWVGIDTTG